MLKKIVCVAAIAAVAIGTFCCFVVAGKDDERIGVE